MESEEVERGSMPVEEEVARLGSDTKLRSCGRMWLKRREWGGGKQMFYCHIVPVGDVCVFREKKVCY